MVATSPRQGQQVTWFLEGMLQHHGAALIMAHDCLKKSSNFTLQRLARTIILAQRSEILEIRRMLRSGGLNSPAYYRYDAYFSVTNPPKPDPTPSLQAPAALQHPIHNH
jgi:hypothetical protein